MGVYLELMKKSFQQKYIYRTDSYISILSTLLKLFVQISVWTALFSRNPTIKGINITDMINFVVINMIVSSLTRSNLANVIADRVNDGTVALDFIKPVNFKFSLLSDEFGENLFRFVFSVLPACIFVAIFYKFNLPPNLINLLLFVISVINGIAIICMINYILGLLSFWLKTSFYVDWFMRAFFELFSGSTVPLWFYPSFLYSLSLAFPFRFISFEPISIYLGKVNTQGAVNIILFQFAWILVLVIIEKFVWKKASELVTVHGG